MAIDALVKPFLSLPLFRGLKPLMVSEIARRADRVIYQPGDFLITEDEIADAAIIIVSGSCVQITADTVGQAGDAVPEGAMLAELAMLVETVHSSSVVARSVVKALRLTRDEIHGIMRDEPRLAEHFTNTIAARLRLIKEELQAVDQALAGIAAHATHEISGHATHATAMTRSAALH